MESTESIQLVDQIQKKLQLVESLLTYAEQQSQMSYLDSPEKYNNLIETKGIIIEQIKKQEIVLQRSISSFKVMNGDIRTQLNGVNLRIDDIMKQIAVLEQKSKAVITDEMRIVKIRLMALQNGKKGIKGYKGSVKLNPAGVFTDSKR